MPSAMNNKSVAVFCEDSELSMYEDLVLQIPQTEVHHLRSLEQVYTSTDKNPKPHALYVIGELKGLHVSDYEHLLARIIKGQRSAGIILHTSYITRFRNYWEVTLGEGRVDVLDKTDKEARTEFLECLEERLKQTNR